MNSAFLTLSRNPHKSGRPSHAYHSYLMSELRLVLDVAVSPGNQMSGRALPARNSNARLSWRATSR